MVAYDQQVIEGQEEEMEPGQLLGQRPNNPGVGRDLSQQHHPREVGDGIPLSEIGHPFFRQCRKNLLSISDPAALEANRGGQRDG
jgi:hypothetical protein